MRTAPLALMLITATIALGACSAAAPTPTPSVTEPAPEPVATTIERDAPRADDDPPQACIADARAMSVAEGGEPVLSAVESAALPTVVVLGPDVEVVASDRPGMFDVVVGVCSEPLPRRVLIGVANEIAVAIAGEPASELVATLTVVGWAPDDAADLQETGRVSTDFPAHAWERGAAAPLSGNWE